MNRNMILMLVALVLSSLVLTACGGGSPSDVGFPTGKFVWEGNEFQGIYLNEDRTWSAFYYGEHVDEGTFTVTDNLYTQDTSLVCPSPASYKWSFDGTNLKFDLEGEDTCDIRRESFDDQTFILTK
jgi:hypothetical protein